MRHGRNSPLQKANVFLCIPLCIHYERRSLDICQKANRHSLYFKYNQKIWSNSVDFLSFAFISNSIHSQSRKPYYHHCIQKPSSPVHFTMSSINYLLTFLFYLCYFSILFVIAKAPYKKEWFCSKENIESYKDKYQKLLNKKT